MVTANRPKLLHRVAAAYGKKNRARFPWRLCPTPYRTFAAEFFLQRTGAEQAASVFKVFIKRFPSLKAATSAEPRRIKKLMKPLGLNHRADAFVIALSQLGRDQHGKMPNRADRFLTLHGVGKYIARATLSFGYGKRVGILDSNVARVLARYFRLTNHPPRPN